MTDFRRLPNLAALRAFEAAARHQSFSRAADELHVTHGAVSHQVRALEEELGIPLFNRHGKRISITPAGARFATTLRKALMDIVVATEEFKSSAQQRRLTISSLPSFASRWLAPRLGKFIDLHPDTEVALQSSYQLVDFSRETVDVAIRFGAGHYPGLAVELVMEDIYFPVASPTFNRGKLPRTPRDIARSMLLRCHNEPWLPWFRKVGLSLPEPSGGLVFEDAAMLVRSAVEGNGIALARQVIVAPELASGELVRLWDVGVKCPSSYYLVCPPQALNKPQVQAFRNWLFAEVAKLNLPTTPL